MSGLDFDEDDDHPLTATSYHPLPAEDRIIPHNPSELWTSGICSCFSDLQSCCLGLWCPCVVFGRNVEALEDRPYVVPCLMHFALYAAAASCSYCFVPVAPLGVALLASYTCGMRRSLRHKYNLEDAPCNDFVTHCLCHSCALCQEYRELKERTGGNITNAPALSPPGLQTMSSFP